MAELTAKKTFSRPQLWETAENADSFEGIGPLDRFGLTKEVQVARAAHAAQYTTLLRAGRTAASHKYLTQEEGSEDDTNLGMKPYRCACSWSSWSSLYRQTLDHDVPCHATCDLTVPI